MTDTYDIRIRQGFGPLRFGASTDDVQALFGPCNEEEIMDDGFDGSRALVWYYWDSGCSFFFDMAGDNRLSCVETSNTDVQLFGKTIFMLGENDVRQLLRENGFTSPDEEMHEWGEKRISFDDAAIDFYFEKGKLVSVNFGVPPGDEGLLSFNS